MKDLKTRDIAEKSIHELEVMLADERAALYKARRDLVFRQMTDRASLKIRRHNMARILTLIGQKQRGGEVAAAPAPKAKAKTEKAAKPVKTAKPVKAAKTEEAAPKKRPVKAKKETTE